MKATLNGASASFKQNTNINHRRSNAYKITVFEYGKNNHNVRRFVYPIKRRLFVLRFYGPGNPIGSCRARSVYLTTRLLGRLSPLSG